MDKAKYEIDHELVQVLINYLASKPYGEVYAMINRMTSLTEIKSPKVHEVET